MDKSEEIKAMLDLIYGIYDEEGISYSREEL
jgi:hypothetical protein